MNSPQATVVEVMRQRGQLSREAERARCGACGAILADDGACHICGSTTHAVGSSTKEPKVESTFAKCPTCKGRINSFLGKCPRCDARPSQPSATNAPPPKNPNLCPRGCGRTVHRGRCAAMNTPRRRESADIAPMHKETRTEAQSATPATEVVSASGLCAAPEAIVRPADPELAVLSALLSLSPAAMGRVIRYVNDRMEDVIDG